MMQILNRCVPISIFFVILHSVTHAQKLPDDIDKSLNNPCDQQKPNVLMYTTLEESLIELGAFIGLLNKFIEKHEAKTDIDYGMSCPNTTHLIWRFTKERKVSVFYNMLLKIDRFIYNILNIIPNKELHYNRRMMYAELFFKLRVVTCSFRNILTRKRKVRKMPHLDVCVDQNWDVTKSSLFDLQFLTNLRIFFKESYNLLSTKGTQS